MKKLIIAAFTVALAVIAHASSVKLIFTDTQASAVDAAIAAGNFASLSALAINSAQSAKAGSFSGVVNGLSGDSATLFAVIFDTYSSTETIANAGYYYRTGTITQTTYDPTRSDPATTAAFTAAQMTGTWTPTAAIPEPTSSLMLLLGMAGLALKRKRA